MIHVDQLTKNYRDVSALRQCCLNIQAGEVFGLLGPNGSGKTTLIRILMGMVRPTSGAAQFHEWDCWKESLQVRRRTSYLPGDARLFSWSRGRDVLKLMSMAREDGRDGGAGFFQRAIGVAERLELDLRRRVAMMSTGMRQKLAIAVAFAPESPLLILDEPTANLDPTVRMEVLRMVQEAKARGQTVLFSSHVLSETEEVCDRVLLLRFGEQVHLQDMSRWKQGHRIWLQPAGGAPQAALGQGLLANAVVEGDWIRVDVADLSKAMHELAAINPQAVRIEPLGLRTIYEEHFHSQVPSSIAPERCQPNHAAPETTETTRRTEKD